MILLIVALTAIISYHGFLHPNFAYQLALWPYRIVRNNEWYRLVTHMFVHGGWTHLIVNMLVFYSFAEALQGVLTDMPGGRYSQTLILYFGGGIISSLVSTERKKNDETYLSIGASAGVSSLVFASICFNPWSPIYFFGLLPIPGIFFGATYLFYSYAMGKRAEQRIDHMAHFYGAAFGVLYPMLAFRDLSTHFINTLLHGPW